MFSVFQKTVLATIVGAAVLIALVIAAKGPALAAGGGGSLGGLATAATTPVGGGSVVPGVLTVGDATVNVKPDTAIVSVGAIAQAATAADAQAAIADRVDRILKQAATLGIAEKDTKTSGYQIQPQYAYAQDKSPRITGYQATEQIQLTIRKIDGLGKALDALTANDAANTMNVRLTIDDPKPAAADARRRAIEDARSKADAMAKAAGASLGRVISVSDLSSPSVSVGDSVKFVAAAPAGRAETQIPTGDLDVTVRVQVQFEIQ